MRQLCFYSALSGRQAAFGRHWRAFGGRNGVKIAVFWCRGGRNVGVHGWNPFSFGSFRVVFGSNRSFLSKFRFGGRIARRAGGGPSGGRAAAAGIQRAEAVRVIHAAGVQGREAAVGATGASGGGTGLAGCAWGPGGAICVLNIGVHLRDWLGHWCSAVPQRPPGDRETLGLFSAMALLSTLYKGAGVPLFFYNGVG